MPLKKIITVAAILITAIACRDYREVHFWIVNNTDDDINVRYRVRTCIGMNSNCFPQNFSDSVKTGDSLMLRIQDQVTTDYEIEESFFDFGLYKNDEASKIDIWRDKLVEKDIFEDHIEFYVRVEPYFF